MCPIAPRIQTFYFENKQSRLTDFNQILAIINVRLAYKADSKHTAAAAVFFSTLVAASLPTAAGFSSTA